MYVTYPQMVKEKQICEETEWARESKNKKINGDEINLRKE